jgi:hypothetical protein
VKTYTERNAGSDRVVMLDAFTITRHGGSATGGAIWQVHSLTPWARDMMADPRAEEIRAANRGIVLSGPDSGRLPTIQFGYGLGFERRGDAADFLRELERVAERYTPRSTTYASRMVRELLDAGPNEGEDFYRLKVAGPLPPHGGTTWLNVTPAQLATIERILEA